MVTVLRGLCIPKKLAIIPADIRYDAKMMVNSWPKNKYFAVALNRRIIMLLSKIKTGVSIRCIVMDTLYSPKFFNCDECNPSTYGDALNITSNTKNTMPMARTASMF